MNKKKLDLTPIEQNLERIREEKAKKEVKATVSYRPLKFNEDPEDSPLKTAIIRKINEKNLTYSDMYSYCTKLRGGSILEGQKLGYNIITGLAKRHTMIDTTFSLLCDFLNYDICLVDRANDDEEEAESNDET